MHLEVGSVSLGVYVQLAQYRSTVYIEVSALKLSSCDTVSLQYCSQACNYCALASEEEPQQHAAWGSHHIFIHNYCAKEHEYPSHMIIGTGQAYQVEERDVTTVCLILGHWRRLDPWRGRGRSSRLRPPAGRSHARRHRRWRLTSAPLPATCLMRSWLAERRWLRCALDRNLHHHSEARAEVNDAAGQSAVSKPRADPHALAST